MRLACRRGGGEDGDAAWLTQPLQVRRGLGNGGATHEAGHLAPAPRPGQLAGDLPDRLLASTSSSARAAAIDIFRFTSAVRSRS